ncbi:hypothetical protein HK101_007168 [Irineochytrium annulatum]|nr:hypothetical protein HK101_007168 [Irineochytrium annulatum]
MTLLVALANRANADGASPFASVPLWYKNYEYLVSASIGSNGAVFDLALDTASADTWVRGSSCQTSTESDRSCDGSSLDLTQPDTSLKPTNQIWDERYGTGEVSGQIYVAPFTLLLAHTTGWTNPTTDAAVGTPAVGATAGSPTNVTTTLLTGVSSRETNLYGFDGILGMGHPAMSEIASRVSGTPFDPSAPQTSASQTTYSTSLLSSLGAAQGVTLFTVWLRKQALSGSSWGSQEVDGRLTLGVAQDDTLRVPDGSAGAWFKLTKSARWQFDISGATYAVRWPSAETTDVEASGSLIGANVTGDAIVEAFVDSGASVIGVDQQVAKDVNAALGVMEDGSIDCNLVDSGGAPDLVLSWKGVSFNIPASYWAIKLDQGCISGVMGSPNPAMIQLGQVFIRRFYTVFDAGGSRVGFFESAQEDSKAPYVGITGAAVASNGIVKKPFKNGTFNKGPQRKKIEKPPKKYRVGTKRVTENRVHFGI